MSTFETVTGFLDAQGAAYAVVEHEAFTSSEEAATLAGINLQEGAKSLLLKASSNFVLAVMPATERLNSKNTKKLLGVQSLRFAQEEELMEIMGCPPGTCYPFGSLVGLRTIADPKLLDSAILACNAGEYTRTITMTSQEYMRIEHPEMADITQ